MEQKKDELNIAICGNATNITAYVEHFFRINMVLNFVLNPQLSS